MEELRQRNRVLATIENYIRFVVRAEEQEAAKTLLGRYERDGLVLSLLLEFYAALPEPQEEAVRKIALLNKEGGVFLFLLSTARHDYLYLVVDQQAHYLGEFQEGLNDPELLGHFSYRDSADFLARHTPPVACTEYLPPGRGGEAGFCPVCGSGEGEPHTLGCPVEICPWCDGRLSLCACRFEQLGVEWIEEERELERFTELLEAKGRIPYSREQRLSYPSDQDS